MRLDTASRPASSPSARPPTGTFRAVRRANDFPSLILRNGICISAPPPQPTSAARATMRTISSDALLTLNLVPSRELITKTDPHERKIKKEKKTQEGKATPMIITINSIKLINKPWKRSESSEKVPLRFGFHPAIRPSAPEPEEGDGRERRKRERESNK